MPHPVLQINEQLRIPANALAFSPIRASGPGGQHVNKVSTAVQLRFDIAASALPADCQARLLASGDRRISREGIVTIKAQRFRSQEKNRADALDRLRQLIVAALDKPKPRRATRPSRAARKRRVDHKTRRGQLKRLRTKVKDD